MTIKKTIHRTFLAAALLASGLAIPQLVRADDTAARAAAASDPEYGAGYLSSWGARQDTNPADVTQSADARRHEEFVKLQQAARAAAASDPEYSAAADSGND